MKTYPFLTLFAFTAASPASAYMNMFGESFLRRELNLSEECQADMGTLGGDGNLSRSLHESIQSFHVELASNQKEYCDTRRIMMDGDPVDDAGYTPTYTSCIIDYEKFSEGYQHQCTNLSNATYFPISIFIECSSSSSSSEVEMQFMNIPICLGRSCGANEVSTALDSALNSQSESVTENGDSQFLCQIYTNVGSEPMLPVVDPSSASPRSTSPDVRPTNIRGTYNDSDGANDTNSNGNSNTLQAISCEKGGCDEEDDYHSSSTTTTTTTDTDTDTDTNTSSAYSNNRSLGSALIVLGVCMTIAFSV